MNKICRTIWSTWCGRRLYLKLRDKYRLSDKDLILFFPENDSNEISSAIRCIPEFIESQIYDRVFCIWTEKSYTCPQSKAHIVLSATESKYLLDFYDLYNFNARFIVVSLRLPWGRMAYKLENFKGMTKEDLYRCQVFH